MVAATSRFGGRADPLGLHPYRHEHPVDRPLKPSDILSTVYRVMGIDQALAFKDHAGRPIPILDEGKPIEEIL